MSTVFCSPNWSISFWCSSDVKNTKSINNNFCLVSFGLFNGARLPADLPVRLPATLSARLSASGAHNGCNSYIADWFPLRDFHCNLPFVLSSLRALYIALGDNPVLTHNTDTATANSAAHPVLLHMCMRAYHNAMEEVDNGFVSSQS